MTAGLIVLGSFSFWMVAYRRIVIDHMLFRKEGTEAKLMGAIMWLYLAFGVACFYISLSA